MESAFSAYKKQMDQEIVVLKCKEKNNNEEKDRQEWVKY